MIKPMRLYALRLIGYGLVLAYLALDIFVFHGFISKKLKGVSPASQQDSTVVATVYHHRILQSQFERVVMEKLWLEGKKPESQSPEQMKWLRAAALNTLIDEAILRTKVQAHASELQPSEAELTQWTERWVSRFANQADFQKAMKEQGLVDHIEWLAFAKQSLMQEKYVEQKIVSGLQIDDESVKQWAAKHSDRLQEPEKWRVAHIFVATLEKSDEQAQAILQAAWEQLKSGAFTFEALAAQVSEDESNKLKGGDLGWLSESRTPPELFESISHLPNEQVALVESKIGWHLLKVMDHQPARERSFEEARHEIRAALETEQRQELVTKWRAALRKQAEPYVKIMLPR